MPEADDEALWNAAPVATDDDLWESTKADEALWNDASSAPPLTPADKIDFIRNFGAYPTNAEAHVALGGTRTLSGGPRFTMEQYEKRRAELALERFDAAYPTIKNKADIRRLTLFSSLPEVGRSEGSARDIGKMDDAEVEAAIKRVHDLNAKQAEVRRSQAFGADKSTLELAGWRAATSASSIVVPNDAATVSGAVGEELARRGGAAEALGTAGDFLGYMIPAVPAARGLTALGRVAGLSASAASTASGVVTMAGQSAASAVHVDPATGQISPATPVDRLLAGGKGGLVGAFGGPAGSAIERGIVNAPLIGRAVTASPLASRVVSAGSHGIGLGGVQEAVYGEGGAQAFAVGTATHLFGPTVGGTKRRALEQARVEADARARQGLPALPQGAIELPGVTPERAPTDVEMAQITAEAARQREAVKARVIAERAEGEPPLSHERVQSITARTLRIEQEVEARIKAQRAETLMSDEVFRTKHEAEIRRQATQDIVIEEESARVPKTARDYRDQIEDIKRTVRAAYGGGRTSDIRPVVRLFRVEPTKRGPGVPDWVRETDGYKGTEAATGRWFTAESEGENADYYKRKYADDSPRQTYVDVPASEAQRYLAANNPEASSFSRRPHEEYFVPPEVASRARVLNPPEVDAHLGNPVEMSVRAEVAEPGLSEPAFGGVEPAGSYTTPVEMGSPLSGDPGHSGLGERVYPTSQMRLRSEIEQMRVRRRPGEAGFAAHELITAPTKGLWTGLNRLAEWTEGAGGNRIRELAPSAYDPMVKGTHTQRRVYGENTGIVLEHEAKGDVLASVPKPQRRHISDLLDVVSAEYEMRDKGQTLRGKDVRIKGRKIDFDALFPTDADVDAVATGALYRRFKDKAVEVFRGKVEPLNARAGVVQPENVGEGRGRWSGDFRTNMAPLSEEAIGERGARLTGNRLRAAETAKPFSGQAEIYDVSLASRYGRGITAAGDALAPVAVFQGLIKDGAAKIVKKGERPPSGWVKATEGVDARFGERAKTLLGYEPYKGDGIYVRPEITRELKSWFDHDAPSELTQRVAGLRVLASVGGAAEAMGHVGYNMLQVAMRAGRWRSALEATRTAFSDNPVVVAKAKARLASVGGAKADFAKGGLAKVWSPLSGSLERATVAIRLMLLENAEAAIKRGEAPNTIHTRRSALIQAGNYDPQMQDAMTRWIKAIPVLNPFVVAGKTGLSNSYKLGALSEGFKTTGGKARAMMAARVAAKVVVPYFAATAAWNIAHIGKPFDESIPLYAWATGKKKDGKLEYTTLPAILAGVAQLWGNTGLGDAVEDTRQGYGVGTAAGDAIAAPLRKYGRIVGGGPLGLRTIDELPRHNLGKQAEAVIKQVPVVNAARNAVRGDWSKVVDALIGDMFTSTRYGKSPGEMRKTKEAR